MIAPPVINLTRENGLRGCSSELLYTLIAYKHTHARAYVRVRAQLRRIRRFFLIYANESSLDGSYNLSSCRVFEKDGMINEETKMTFYFC